VEPEPNNPAGVLLPNYGFHSGIVSDQFMYKPIGQVTPIRTVGLEVFFRCGGIEGSASEGGGYSQGASPPASTALV